MQCCGIWRSLSTRRRSWLRSTGAVIIGRPDRPSSIVAPNRNHKNGIGDVGQQPQRRPGGSSRSSARRSRGRCASACRRARLARAWGQRI
jgi:hypothetical protein